MAKKNTSISLGEPFIEFARRKVESGEFGSTSEVVREAMRGYMAEDAKLTALRKAIDEGLASPLVDFDARAWIEEEMSGE